MPPKLAGLARKNVELSLVRLITAEGGNREEGVWKEKRTRRRLGGEPESAVRASAWPGCADIKERKVRKMGRVMKQKSKRRSRGGRIGGKASPDMLWGDARWSAAKEYASAQHEPPRGASHRLKGGSGEPRARFHYQQAKLAKPGVLRGSPSAQSAFGMNYILSPTISAAATAASPAL
jgi:hypothetical protein